MNNRYEAPESLKLGKAQDVILDQKQPYVRSDNFLCPYCWDNDTIDDFDE